MSETRYIYRAVYQHGGKDAGAVPHTEASTAAECRARIAVYGARGSWRIRRYAVPVTGEAVRGA